MCIARPRFLQNLDDVVVVEHNTAQFECELNQTAQSVKWVVGGHPVQLGTKYRFTQTGAVHRLQIVDVLKEEEGDVEIICGDLREAARLYVIGKGLYLRW